MDVQSFKMCLIQTLCKEQIVLHEIDESIASLNLMRSNITERQTHAENNVTQSCQKVGRLYLQRKSLVQLYYTVILTLYCSIIFLWFSAVSCLPIIFLLLLCLFIRFMEEWMNSVNPWFIRCGYCSKHHFDGFTIL